jgi:hypothetical protein
MSTAERSNRFRLVLPYLAVFLLALSVGCLHNLRYRPMSPIDELRHLDYAVKISNGELTHMGDKIGEIAMREESCRGLDLPDWVDPPCDTPVLDPIGYRDDGWQTASPHPPLYYLGAGILGRTLNTLGITSSYLEGARFFSALLTALGITLVFHLLRRLKIGTYVAMGASLMLMVFPSVIHSSGTVTPDSASILVGAVVAIAVVKYLETSLGLRGLALAGLFAGAVKLTNLLAAAAAAVFLIVASDAWGDFRRRTISAETKCRLIGAGTVFGCALATTLPWLVIDSVRATIDPAIVPQNMLNKFEGLPPLDFLIFPDVSMRWFPPANNYLHINFLSEPILFFSSLTTVILAGAVVVCLLRAKRTAPVLQFGAVGGVVALFGSPLFSLASTAYTSTLVRPEGRYGLSLGPFFVVAVASQAETRTGRRILGTFGLVVVVSVIVMLIIATSAPIPAPPPS